MKIIRQTRARLLAALPAELQVEAARRYDAQAPLLFDRLSRLYGEQPRFEAWCGELMATAGALLGARSKPLQALDARRLRQPGWFLDRQMLGYCAYVDRFAGTLRQTAARVPYLRELGVNYLHLLPFLKMRSGDNDGGFAVSSFDEIEPRLGDMNDLESLTAILRDAGISLCADFVLNHVADDHPWVRAALGGDPHYQRFFHLFPDRSRPDLYQQHLGEVFPAVAPGNFTPVPTLGGWVWTTFYPYQWDLNYANPDLFAEIASSLLKLANRGVEVFRLDSAPFLWKRLGTACVNQPEVHLLLQALRCLVEIAAPGVLLKAEAIVPVRELAPYFGDGAAQGRECHLAYHSGLMAAGWAALAEQRTELLRRVIEMTPVLPGASSWATYVRCHDDIVWSTLRPEIEQGGKMLDARLAPVSQFLAGSTPGSFARGAAFQAMSSQSVFGSNGMTASLVGFDTAVNETESNLALRRLRLLYALAFSIGGLPLIYMGDELAQGNDVAPEHASLRGADGRWLQRPKLDEKRVGQREDPATTAGRAWAAIHELARCRRRLPILAADEPRSLVSCDDPALLVLRRGESFCAVMNFSAQPRQLARGAALGVSDQDLWFDCFSGQAADATISVHAWGFRWLERRGAAGTVQA